MGTFLGFDPGGIGAFGWAILAGEQLPLCLVGRGIADHAQGAFNAAMKSADKSSIKAVGIDAPLYWSAEGDRRADQIVRKAITKLGSSGGTVNAVNSLQGACLVQGMLIALMCREALAPGTPISEAHPKALLWLLGEANAEHHPKEIKMSVLKKYVVGNGIEDASEHERDATLGAVTAFAAIAQLPGWEDLYQVEAEKASTKTLFVPPPMYWMPLNTLRKN